MTTTVVNLRAEPYDVYIGRAGQGQDGYFGNPIRLANYYNQTERERVLGQYAEYFNRRVDADVEFARRVLALRGKRLGCFCKPMRCHGDVMAAWIDSAICAEGCGNPATVVIDTETAYPNPAKVILLCQECIRGSLRSRYLETVLTSR